MAANINRQPVFTAIPITICIGTDIEKNDTNVYYTNKATTIYSDASTYGTMINRVTVNANATLAAGEKVSRKRIDLYISNDGDNAKFDLYASQHMQELNPITATSTVPSVVFEFPTGLVLSPGKKLGISATENSDNSSYAGDLVSIIVEGGTYDLPA